jgi:T5SS/PEP-CTERM-associated repeat protein
MTMRWNIMLAVMLGFVILAGSNSLALTHKFNIETGAWTNDALWYSGVPTAAVNELAIIGRSSEDITCTIGSGDSAVAYNFYVSRETASGDTTTLKINPEGRLDISGSALFGYTAGATGIVTVAGGILNCGLKDLSLGFLEGSYGILNVSSGSVTNNKLWVGRRTGTTKTTGEVNLSGGLIFSQGDTLVGAHAGCTGIVNQTGGTLNGGGNKLAIGNQGIGTVTLSGGTITNVKDVALGVSGGSDGTLEISGGTLSSIGSLTIGANTSSTGTLKIIGSAATINFLTAGKIFTDHGAATSTLEIVPDSGGISPINIAANVALNDIDLEVDFSDFDGHANSLVLIDFGGNCSGTFATTNILPSGWTCDVVYDNVGDEVRLDNIRSGETRFETVDGNWTNALRWTDGVPTATTDATVEKNGGITASIETGDDADAADLTVGDTTSGGITMTGGTLDVTSITLGAQASGSGSLSLSGNAALTVTADLSVGYNDAGELGSTNTMTITGSGATISAGDDLLIGNKSSLAFVADSGGVSTIVAADRMWLPTGSTLSVDLSNWDMSQPSLLLIDYDGGYTYGPTKIITPSGWSASFVNNTVDDKLYLTNIVATITRFNIGDGDWDASANWSPSVPTASQDAYIGKSGGITATIRAGMNALTDELHVGVEGNEGTLAIESGTLTIDATSYVGDDAAGIVNQSGGSVNGSGYGILLGQTAGVSGTYTLSGGSLTNVEIKVGEKGIGVFNLTNSVLFQASAASQIGHQVGSTGTVNQSGGTWDNAGKAFSLGVNGSGTYNLSSGVLTNLAGNPRVGGESGSHGTLNISGTGMLVNGPSPFYLAYEAGATGSVVQTGGTFDNGGRDLEIGSKGVGSYTLSAGIVTNLGIIHIGRLDGSQGTLTLNGNGKLIADNEINIGKDAGATGVVTVAGGTLAVAAAADIFVGRIGVGSLTVSSGSITNPDEIKVGHNAGGHGTFALSGTGDITMANHLSLGHLAGSTGVMTVAGGSLEFTSIDDDLIIGRLGVGTATVSGGTITNVRQVILGYLVGSSGTLEISGGELYMEDLFVGRQSSTNTLAIVGSTATISVSNDILSTAGSRNTWSFRPDSSGISTINVADDITLSGTLEIDLADYGEQTGSITLIDYNGTLNGSFTSTNILNSSASRVTVQYVDDPTDKIIVYIGLSPPTLFKFR